MIKNLFYFMFVHWRTKLKNLDYHKFKVKKSINDLHVYADKRDQHRRIIDKSISSLEAKQRKAVDDHRSATDLAYNLTAHFIE